MYQVGFLEYIIDVQNLQTIIFVITGLLNGVVHYISTPYSLTSKYIMIGNLIFSL
jgi:hypothetical protein